MKKTLAVLGGAVLALSALLAPLQVSVSPAYGDGLVDISTCNARSDNCAFDMSKWCASDSGGWVEYYCNLWPGPHGQGMPCDAPGG